MAGRSFSIILSAFILVIIGGWFIIAALLPILGIETGYESITVAGAIMYLYFGYDVDVQILYWLFPVLGLLGFFVGFRLFAGKGRGLGIIAYLVTLILSVLGLIVVFAFSGVDTAEGMWEYVIDALKSGDVVATLGYVLEPLLIAAGSAIGLLLLIFGKKE
ncbi:MAG: hypothetical protein FWG58_04600 [Methanomassiliicoccaceae archaeon]|nr:hypothetical protein [Methanomassiliicoccaceae archaeon]